MSNTLKCQKFNLGINNESVFLVDWYEIRKNVCKRTWILTHANHPATSTALDVMIFFAQKRHKKKRSSATLPNVSKTQHVKKINTGCLNWKFWQNRMKKICILFTSLIQANTKKNCFSPQTPLTPPKCDKVSSGLFVKFC